jgi:hypothetical protein
MKIRVGFEIIYDFPQPTPIITVLGTHFTRASDIIVPDHLTISPSVPITPYRDGFGNWCAFGDAVSYRSIQRCCP